MGNNIPLRFVECPYCGSQEMFAVGDGSIIRRFDMRLLDRKFKAALKGQYHTWTCKKYGNKFIRSNVLCGCTGYGKETGVVIKSEKPRPTFTCSKCMGKTKNL